jgi:hypothetical protein
VPRILAAVGALAAVLIVGIGAVTVVGSPNDTRPDMGATTQDAGTPDASTRVDDAERQAELARRLQAARDEVSQAVEDEAERLAAKQP